MTVQDPLDWVLALAGLLLGLVFCLLVFTLMLRVMAAREQRRRESVRRVWQPILFDSLYTGSAPESLPPLEKRSVPAFSELWCSLLESVSGSARQRMTEVGRRLELADRVAPLIRHRRFSYRLLAMHRQPPAIMPFVLQLMAGLRLELPGDALSSLAASPEGQKSDVLSQLLSLVQQPDQHDWMVKQLDHESPQVRVQAARALLRLGRPEDLERLMPLLRDRVWWVRYRAMQAILALPNVDIEEVRALVEELADPFARDIFQHVEREESRGYRGEHGYLAH